MAAAGPETGRAGDVRVISGLTWHVPRPCNGLKRLRGKARVGGDFCARKGDRTLAAVAEVGTRPPRASGWEARQVLEMGRRSDGTTGLEAKLYELFNQR